jgi:hypothetical protein
MIVFTVLEGERVLAGGIFTFRGAVDEACATARLQPLPAALAGCAPPLTIRPRCDQCPPPWCAHLEHAFPRDSL